MESDRIVSVIVPIYNAEIYLAECVESIINQTYRHLEIILVDDGSTDGSSGMCDEFARSDSRIRVIHKENGGLVSAWRAGLLDTNSNSEFIVFVDADDWIEEKHILCMVEEQEKTGTDVVVVRMKQTYKNRETYIDFVAEPKFYSGDCLKKELYPILLNAGGFERRGVPVSRWGKLIRKKILLDNVKYSEDNTTYEEDLNIMFPVFMDMESISLLVCENGAYCYRMNENSMLHAYDKNMLASIRHVYSAIQQACRDKQQDFFQKQINIEYLSAMLRACTNELQTPYGIHAGFCKVKEIAEDNKLQSALHGVECKYFPFKTKLVIFLLRHSSWIGAEILFAIMWIIKGVHKRLK